MSSRLRAAPSLLVIVACALVLVGRRDLGLSAQSAGSPSTYAAYTGTDVRVPPVAPTLGAVNSVITDPDFSSKILRVTDSNTSSGMSFISTDAGFSRTFNANSTAIKLTNPQGWSYWEEFSPSAFTVGDGSSQPVPHALTAFDARWEWSAVNPNLLYFLSGSTISAYNIVTGTTTPLASTPNGDPVQYHVAVLGQDAWVCSAAGSGQQDTYTEIFCVNPNQPSTVEFINVPAATINGVPQTSANWPTSAAGQTIGIHSLDGSAGGSYLGVTFHQQSWGANGDSVLNLTTNTWSLVTNADAYWSGHTSLGNGKFVNGGGSIDGKDSRGAVVRNPDDLMNSSEYQFIMQPPSTCCWNDAEHSSWFNSSTNPNAPVLFSRYTITTTPWLTWMSEIVLAATDGSNTVWRIAHTHQDPGCYYGQGFAQISNDGNWAIFSSTWDGTLGTPAGFDCATRVDTFIVALNGSSAGPTPPPPATPPTVAITAPASGSTVSGTAIVSAVASSNAGISSLQVLLDGTDMGPALTTAPYSLSWTTTATPNGAHTLTATAVDAAGNSATSSPVTVTVSNTTSTPAPPPPSGSGSSSGSGSGTAKAATEPVVWTNLDNATVLGTTLEKTGGCGGCPDAGATSQQLISSGAGYVEFTAADNSTLRWVGLSHANPANNGSAIDFALRIQAGDLEVSERGVYRTDVPLSVGDVVRVAIVNGKVAYYKNGQIFYTGTVAPTYPLMAAAALYDLTATVTNAVVTVAPTTVAITWTDLVNASVSGSTVTKTGGCDGCQDAGAAAQQMLGMGDGYFEFTAPEVTSLRVAGLTGGSPVTTIASISFGLRIQQGDLEVEEQGLYRADTPVAPGSTVRVAVQGGKVVYSLNGTAFYTSATAPSYPLRPEAVFLSLGSAITNGKLSGRLTTSQASGSQTAVRRLGLTPPGSAQTGR